MSNVTESMDIVLNASRGFGATIVVEIVTVANVAMLPMVFAVLAVAIIPCYLMASPVSMLNVLFYTS